MLGPVFFFLLAFLSSQRLHVEGLVRPLPQLPENLQYHFDVYKQMTSLDQQSGSAIFWASLEQYTSRFVESRRNMSPSEQAFFRQNVQEFMLPIYSNSSRAKRQARRRAPRVRMEIRSMSIPQRRTYFRAVIALKNDRRLTPNIYDVLADFHTGGNIARAHFGPAFAAWHRVYLWLYESFLRLHEPTTTIPYWGSVLDNEMADSTESVIWSDGFFGNGVGEINSGPFRDWPTINPNMVFRRNIGSGPLYTYADIDAILNKTRNRQIFVPTADPDSDFELLHGGPHVYVGGSMNRLNEAVRDPVFYSHHCFVDYIWEMFRIQQRNRGINPETDYPFDRTNPAFNDQHAPTSMMNFFPNNELTIDYPNSVGFRNVFTDLVRYRPIPRCPSCDGSPYLFCNRNLPVPRCVGRTRRGMRGQSYVDDLFGNEPAPNANTTGDSDPSAMTCPRKPFLKEMDSTREPVRNSYSWAYIPVKIISKRPPAYPKFKDYSLYSYGGLQNDPSAPLPQTKLSLVSKGTQKGYRKCYGQEEAVGKIKIVTYGLNYYGKTEEYAIIDNRMGMSQSSAYAVVKAPSAGSPSDAMVAAFDSCGRVCRPFCIQGTDPSSTSKFTGGMRVTTETPLQYGYSYADATLDSWDMPADSGNPVINSLNIPLTFYCDYQTDWVWDGQAGNSTNAAYTPNEQGGNNQHSSSSGQQTGSTGRGTGGAIQGNTDRINGGMPQTNRQRHQSTTAWVNQQIGITGNSSVTNPVQMPVGSQGVRSTGRRGQTHQGLSGSHSGRPQMFQSGGLTPNQGCLVSRSCRIPVACSPCHLYQIQRCIGSPQEAVCVDGVFQLYDIYAGRG